MSKKPPPPPSEPFRACGASVTVYNSTTGKLVQRSCVLKSGHGGSHHAEP